MATPYRYHRFFPCWGGTVISKSHLNMPIKASLKQKLCVRSVNASTAQLSCNLGNLHTWLVDTARGMVGILAFETLRIGCLGRLTLGNWKSFDYQSLCDFLCSVLGIGLLDASLSACCLTCSKVLSSPLPRQFVEIFMPNSLTACILRKRHIFMQSLDPFRSRCTST